MKNTSATKDGKGGAERVNRNVKINKNLNKGEVRIRPRIKTNWREENIEYKTPTDIKRTVEESPCNSITRIKAWTANELLDITKNGITIIWATDE